MLLADRRSHAWIAITGVLAALATAAYFIDAPRHASGPSGSTVVGLALGVAAYALMLFCALLSFRRKVPHWRLGRAQVWLRAHVWLGLLIVVLVALHAAFRAGGPLTTLLWALLAFVTASGVFGVLLQQFIPRILLHGVAGETVAQQIQAAILDCAKQAEAVVVQFAGSLDKPAPPMPAPAAAAAATTNGAPPAASPASPAPPASPPGPAAATAVAVAPSPPAPAAKPPPPPGPPMGGEPLRRFYVEAARGFFEGQPTPLASEAAASTMLASLRTATPAHIHPGVDELAALITRHRRLQTQRRWMLVLHGWLIVHIPLSWAFIALVGVHAVMALRYWGAA